MDLYERIAQALGPGWTVRDVHSFSPGYLRDLLRPINPSLADEIGAHETSGQAIIGERIPK